MWNGKSCLKFVSAHISSGIWHDRLLIPNSVTFVHLSSIGIFRAPLSPEQLISPSEPYRQTERQA